MIKYLIAFLLMTTPCLAGMGVGGFPYPGPGVLVANGSTCPETPFIQETVSNNSLNFGDSTATYFAGFTRTATGTDTLCSIDVYLQRGGGTAFTNGTIYVEKWTTNSGTGYLETKVADLGTIDPTTLPNGSYGWYSIQFASDVTMNQYDAIILTLNETRSISTYVKVSVNTSGTTMTEYRSRSYSSAFAPGGSVGSVDMTLKLYGSD